MGNRKLLLILFILLGVHGYGQTPLNFLLAKKRTVSAGDTIAVNFYGSTGSGTQVSVTNWNNVPSATPTTSGTNLVYLSNGVNSGIGISFPLAAAGNWSDNGNMCPSPTDGFPAQAYVNSLYHTTNGITITLSGCNDAKTYDILWLSSRATATHRVTLTTVQNGGLTVFWEAGNNCTLHGTITNLVSSGGIITLSLGYSTGSFTYMNACKIVEH